jgi:hypothetical protein
MEFTERAARDFRFRFPSMCATRVCNACNVCATRYSSADVDEFPPRTPRPPALQAEVRFSSDEMGIYGIFCL